VAVRERRADDVDGLVTILRDIEAEGYPPHRPDGPEAWVNARDEIAAFVYESDSTDVVGHVALHEYSARSVMDLAASALETTPDRLAAIARLFVDPVVRRSGAGRSLLRVATDLGHTQGRHPVLDVWENLPAAISMYEGEGWTRVGRVEIQFNSPCTPRCVHEGTSIRSFVYVAPRR